MNDSANNVTTPSPRRFDGLTVAAYAIACLAPLITAGLFLDATRSAGVDIGFPLDDSWIHAQYARTIVEGRPLQYVEGELSMGTTAPLFDVLWAAGTLLTGEYVYTIYALNVALTCGLAALLVAWLLRFKLPPLTAGFGAALIVTSYPFTWSNLSGMETALASVLTVGSVLAHLTWGRRSGWRSVAPPILMALAVMARPENLVLYPLSELDHLWLRWRRADDADRSRAWPRFLARFAAYALAILPYFALNYSIHGALVPNTFNAKVGRLGFGADIQEHGLAALGDRLHAMRTYATSAFWFVWAYDNAVMLAFAAAGVLLLFARQFLKIPDDGAPAVVRSLLPLLIFVVGSGAVGFITMDLFFPGQSQRYLIHRIPLILVYGVVGADLVARGMATRFSSAARPVYASLIVMFVVGNWVHLKGKLADQVTEYVTSVKNINEMQVALGHWVNENTPEDAVIATNDIGAIAFFGHRPIVDTIGLIDPEVVRRKNLPDHTDQMLTYLKQRNVSYALLFPSWHPDLILNEHFTPIHRVVLTDNVICGYSRMLVLKVDWNHPRSEHSAPDWAEDELAQAKSWLKRKAWMPF